MLLDDVWALFEETLFDVPSTDTLFNPYHDAEDPLGRPGAPHLRRDNLRRYLAAYDRRPPLLLVAEAPGPWGCRFSGVPLTSEAQLLDPAHPLDGLPSARADEPHTEYSGSIFWRVLTPVFPHFFVWNSVPLHPHDAGAPLTIRTPRRREVARWEPLLHELVDHLAPERVVAIGRKAERALREVDAEPTYVRHPSQGGAKKFEAGMHAIAADMGLDAS
jgi:uracil-DNA glycosylase